MSVPCGKCRACRIARAREWSMRVMHECESWDASSFATMTYDDAHMPGSNGLEKRDFQLFIKRLRRGLGERRMKYYGCGEYGDRFGRPHYHAILFGVDQSEKALVEEAWSEDGQPIGWTMLGSVSWDSARYVADYVHKDTRKEMYGGREPPFSLKSQGLGKDWADANAEQLRANGRTSVHGSTVGLPRYYIDRVGVPRSERIAHAEAREAEQLQELRKRFGPARLYEVMRMREQAELNLRKREEMYRKGSQ